ncbi:hypothetical protein Fmac_004933 [Flemingia macrophylla]|uniref:Uncharacterized protein n=1 Tax=Flemingia macrophylla TaxID=520843 RepID=A0ABD1N6A5_9FABA
MGCPCCCRGSGKTTLNEVPSSGCRITLSLRGCPFCRGRDKSYLNGVLLGTHCKDRLQIGVG